MWHLWASEKVRRQRGALPPQPQHLEETLGASAVCFRKRGKRLPGERCQRES